MGVLDVYKRQEYYPEEDNTLKEMTSGKFGGIGSVIRYYTPRKRVAIIEPFYGHYALLVGCSQSFASLHLYE